MDIKSTGDLGVKWFGQYEHTRLQNEEISIPNERGK